MAGSSSRHRVQCNQSDGFELSLALEAMTRPARQRRGLRIGFAADPHGQDRIKRNDVGVVCSASGYTVFLGGEARLAGQRLGEVRGERALMEVVCAFVRLFDDEAGPHESTAAYLRRASLLYVRERLLRDPLGRSMLMRELLDEAGPPRKVRSCAFSGIS